MNLDNLEAVAQTATPGPWHVDEDDRPNMEWNRHIMADRINAVCFMAHSDNEDPARDKATAEFIAAFNPQVAIKLIAVARLARRVAFSEGFDAAYPEHLEALRSALRELEQP